MGSELIHVKLLKRFLTPGKHSVRVCVCVVVVVVVVIVVLPEA